MKRALIITNAYSALPSSLHQSGRLKTELEALGAKVDIRRNDLNLFVSREGKIEGADGNYDFCIYLDKDKYTANMLELTGLRLFNSAKSIAVCDDKMLTHIALSGRGISMPKTLPAALCYTPDAAVPESLIERVERELGYPVIVKESYGSLGKGVYKADNRGELNCLSERLKLMPHLFQQFIASSCGRDIRVIVVGGKCIAAMQRVSRGDFRSNIELGGEGFPYEIDAKLNDICVSTAKILGLDYCGIDILFGEEGYLVCEVNSNAFFGGIEKAARVNIARAYAEYIIDNV